MLGVTENLNTLKGEPFYLIIREQLLKLKEQTTHFLLATISCTLMLRFGIWSETYQVLVSVHQFASWHDYFFLRSGMYICILTKTLMSDIWVSWMPFQSQSKAFQLSKNVKLKKKLIEIYTKKYKIELKYAVNFIYKKKKKNLINNRKIKHVTKSKFSHGLLK